MDDLLKGFDFTPEQRALIMQRIETLSDEEVIEMERDVSRLLTAQKYQRCRTHYLDYVKQMWPGFIGGRHFNRMADAFERIANGTLKRCIINMAPRHGKSENGSIFFPSWYLGKFPDHRVMMATHTSDLAVDFGSKVKEKLGEPEYKRIFPGVQLNPDKKASGHWRTNHRGEYFAVGVGSNIAGRGAHLFIIDDPESEQTYNDGMSNPDAWDKAYNWFINGVLSRLSPDGSILIIQTRWHKRDLTGQIREAIQRGDTPEDWEIIEFPAILHEDTARESAIWPEFWPLEKLQVKRAEIKAKPLGIHIWNANYQQNPTSEAGAIVKREWWMEWSPEVLRHMRIAHSIDDDNPGFADPPKCEYIIQAWDTAFTAKEKNDPSYCTTWGVFRPWPETNPQTYHIILLNAVRQHLQFSELKLKAKVEIDTWKPDAVLIEAKGSGISLVQELRMAGIPLEDYSPNKRSQDKVARLFAVSDLFSSGMVWAPPLSWARNLIEEMAEFPNGDHDDGVDSTSLALARFRRGGFVRLPSDEAEEEAKPTAPREYY